MTISFGETKRKNI